MPAQVFGADAVVTMMNLALNGPGFYLNPTLFANQKAAALANEAQYANDLAASFQGAYPTDLAYAQHVLNNLGVGDNVDLVNAVAAYLAVVTPSQRGIVTLQLGQILSGLEGPGPFGQDALEWNSLVAAWYVAWSNGSPAPAPAPSPSPAPSPAPAPAPDPEPEITVTGNAVNINDGDTTPSIFDHTDFGSSTVGGAELTRVFTVFNSGTAALSTSGLNLPSGFQLVEALSATIAAGTSDTFTVKMLTGSTGVKSGQISFTTNDLDENPFNFAITGTVNAVPVPPPPPAPAPGPAPAPVAPGFFMTVTANESLIGTNIDDVFAGSDTTYQGGDSVTGGDGNDTLRLSFDGKNSPYNNVSLFGIERVEIDADGSVEIGASKWNKDLHTVRISNKSTGNVTIMDLQEDSSNSIYFELIDVSADVKLNFDKQAVDEPNNTVRVLVQEMTGALALEGEAGEGIERTIINVQDLPGAPSALKSLTATKSETVEIWGGLAGQAFTIGAPLDASLKVVSADTAQGGVFVGNLVLDVSANGPSQALAFTGGSGNDKVYTGDAWGDGDVFKGGANYNGGVDEIWMNFTTLTDGTRAATMSGFEVAHVTFGAPESFEGGLVDDLKTINLYGSSPRADFNAMDSTFDTLNIRGNLGGGVEVDYDGDARATLNIDILERTSSIQNAGNKAAIRVINADTVNLTHKGDTSVTLSNGLQVDDQFANGRSTSRINIVNASNGDLTINPMFNGLWGVVPGVSAIVDGNDVQHLSITTTQQGDIRAGDFFSALMEEANSLRTFKVQTSVDGDITLGLVGDRSLFGGIDGNPSNLESIEFSAAISSDLFSYGVDADDTIDGTGGSASTVTYIGIKGASSSNIGLFGSPGVVGSLSVARPELTGYNWLQAASIGVMDVESYGQSVFGGVFGALELSARIPGLEVVANYLIGLDLESQQAGSRINLSGRTVLPGFYFQDEVPAVIDASNLAVTPHGYVSGPIGQMEFAVIANTGSTAPAAAGFTFHGTGQRDLVLATSQADTLNGNGDRDVLIGFGGNDSINGGDGDDVIFGDAMDPSLLAAHNALGGSDVLSGGQGADLIVGGRNVVGGGDLMTGNAGSDTFAFVFDRTVLPAAPTVLNNPSDGYTEAGKSTSAIKQDVITDFTPGTDRIDIDALLADNTYTILYFNSDTAAPVVISNGDVDVQIVIRRGTYSDGGFGTFNLLSTGADLQVLFAVDGGDFAAGVDGVGGFIAYNQAAHEVALINVSGALGSLAHTDFLFV